MSGSRSTAIPFAVGSFGLGTFAIVAVLSLSVTGHANLPMWLDLATMLAPVGLVTGVVAVVFRAVRSPGAAERDQEDADDEPTLTRN